MPRRTKLGRPKEANPLRYRQTIRMDRRTNQALLEISQAEHCDVADVIRTAIESYIEDKFDEYGYLPTEDK